MAFVKISKKDQCNCIPGKFDVYLIHAQVSLSSFVLYSIIIYSLFIHVYECLLTHGTIFFLVIVVLHIARCLTFFPSSAKHSSILPKYFMKKQKVQLNQTKTEYHYTIFQIIPPGDGTITTENH